jgi:Skp family chaperone for outer membrane proteins
MTNKTWALAACASLAIAASGSSAWAQAAAPVQPTINYGAPIAGMCVFDFDRAVATSTVGKYVDTRLGQIGQQVNAELMGEKTSIENDARALDGARNTLDQNTLEQRASALQVRQNALERKAALRQREMQATEQESLGRVANEMQPLVAQAAQAKSCAIVLARGGVVAVNPAMDITQAVVTGLNAKVSQFAFDRTRLDQPAASAPPVAQTPAQRK